MKIAHALTLSLAVLANVMKGVESYNDDSVPLRNLREGLGERDANSNGSTDQYHTFSQSPEDPTSMPSSMPTSMPSSMPTSMPSSMPSSMPNAEPNETNNDDAKFWEKEEYQIAGAAAAGILLLGGVYAAYACCCKVDINPRPVLENTGIKFSNLKNENRLDDQEQGNVI